MKKCDKYESYFLFLSDADFQKHLKECEECRLEHEKMEKISALVKEVKPYYSKKRKVETFYKKVACMVAMFVMCGSWGIIKYSDYNLNYNYLSVDDIESSYISAMGMPVDSYGLLMVD